LFGLDPDALDMDECVGEHVTSPLYPFGDPGVSRVLKNKHQAVSQGRNKLEARGLRLEA
jgi:hypothetical protein